MLSAYACDWLEADFCYIRNTKPFGGTYIGEPRPFVGSIHKFSGEHFAEHSAAEVHAIEMLTHRVFTHSVLLAAMCNQAVDHRILGELSAAIAERFEGMVDFDSLDAPIDELGLLKCAWSEDGCDYWTVLGSADTARKWLAHDRFHMLK